MFGNIGKTPIADLTNAQLKGKVVLMHKTFPGSNVTDPIGSIWDKLNELLGLRVTCQLISSTVVDPNNGNRGMVGTEAPLEDWLLNQPSLLAIEHAYQFGVTFNWEVEKQGVPGAIIVRNNHDTEFFLKTITLDDVPGHGTIVFVANSWMYPQYMYSYDRVFFTNDTYLPSQMPAALKLYRVDELQKLRGEGDHQQGQGPYKEHDRVYRYDLYNDLGDPDGNNPRPTLGGSKDHPYPRRGRTGRKPTQTDPACESRQCLLLDGELFYYVPRDERFGHVKNSDFVGRAFKDIMDVTVPFLESKVFRVDFDSFRDILDLYEGGIKMRDVPAVKECTLKLPMPKIIQDDRKAWMSDEEFARETLAGMNPVVIRRLTEFPPKSTLDPSMYGDQTSTITEAHIAGSLEGLTVQQALDGNRLYILDHHDHFMPFLTEVNSLEGNFIYATRTLLFLRGDGTLAPVAIELSLPELRGDGVTAAKSTVYTPPPVTARDGPEAWVWRLAKAYVSVNDQGWHQGISHWLNTHAVMEPFVIATKRQLSVTHPVHRLLLPHFRDTMNINALARQLLICADGIFEKTVFLRKYAFEITSKVYAHWNLAEQALPDDLIKRGMAVPDPSSPYKVRLLIEDYPYASDGLAVWHAIELWVTEYLAIYYPNDGVVQADDELQEWWKEARDVGHADLKDEPWWPKMQTVAELVRACATIIWIASALHAAVNFGQYPYAGYHPNRPTMSRRPMPVPGSEAYKELEDDPEKFFVHSINVKHEAVIGIALLEILSSFSSDEVYLGQRDTKDWTSDAKVLEAFKKFAARLTEIEKRVEDMNADPRYKNRYGPARFPYTLLYPNTSSSDPNKGDNNDGITAKGIPNSISI